MKLKITIIICYLFLLSCNVSAPTQSNNSTSSNTDDVFSGTWVYSNEYPKKIDKDNSMDGSTCIIRKVEGTEQSYYVDVLNDQDDLFTKEDDSTLKSVTANFQIRYSQQNQHIIYKFYADSLNGIEYYKLK